MRNMIDVLRELKRLKQENEQLTCDNNLLQRLTEDEHDSPVEKEAIQ